MEGTHRAYFEGILCVLDEPSSKPPSGSRGHNIILTKNAAVNVIDTLIGAPINYTPAWDAHNYNVSIGLITQSFILGKFLKIRGYLSVDRYPTLVKEIKTLVKPLGLSYEIQNAHIEDMRQPIWKITRLGSFTGVAILLKSKAAYRSSTFELL